MPSLLITLNGTALIHASISEYCSLGWDISCSRREQDFGRLMVSGLIARSDGKCDFDQWEEVVLDAGDELLIQMLPSSGTTPMPKRQTWEEHEALRLEVARAEAAGEYDAARAARPELQRSSCGIALSTPDASRETRATGLIDAVLCSGNWIDLRPKEWRLGLYSFPAEPNVDGFWQPTEGGIRVKLLLD